MRGQYAFMNTQILNTYLNRCSTILRAVDRSYIGEYANGVDTQYDQFLRAQIEACKSHVPVVEFMSQMQTFRDKCERFRQADTEYVADFCNYAFQAHYNLTQVARILKKEEKAGVAKMNSRTADQILFFLRNILVDSDRLNKTKLEAKDPDACYLMEDMSAAFVTVKTFYKNPVDN